MVELLYPITPQLTSPQVFVMLVAWTLKRDSAALPVNRISIFSFTFQDTKICVFFVLFLKVDRGKQGLCFWGGRGRALPSPTSLGACGSEQSKELSRLRRRQTASPFFLIPLWCTLTPSGGKDQGPEQCFVQAVVLRSCSLKGSIFSFREMTQFGNKEERI